MGWRVSALVHDVQLDHGSRTPALMHALTLWRRTMHVQVVYDGRTAEVPCKPGAEGLDDFKHQVRLITRAGGFAISGVPPSQCHERIVVTIYSHRHWRYFFA